ncbi:hypothetical protein D3C73_1234240 [compost metagenome]
MIQVSPSAVNFDISFIQIPGEKTEWLMPVPAETFLHFRGVALNPAVKSGVVDVGPAFGQNLLQLTITDGVFTVPVYRSQNNFTTEMPTFEYVHD